MADKKTTDNPAHDAAKGVVEALKPIPIPRIETFKPKELSAAAAAYALKSRKVRAAEEAIEALKLKAYARMLRLQEIAAILAEEEQRPPIDIWCASCTEGLTGEVASAEVPGYGDEEEKTLRTATLYKGKEQERTVVYTERRINLRPTGMASAHYGDRVHAEGMTDAAVAYNLAMEPGHLRWKPIWRYGVLTADADDQDRCTLVLDQPNPSRRLAEDARNDLPLDEVVILSGVPIYYPPCHGRVFKENDAVLVLFEGYARNQPKVIGFRREPKLCPRTWQELR